MCAIITRVSQLYDNTVSQPLHSRPSHPTQHSLHFLRIIATALLPATPSNVSSHIQHMYPHDSSIITDVITALHANSWVYVYVTVIAVTF